MRDYEAEIEFTDNAAKTVESVITALGLAAISHQNKSARFFKMLESGGDRI